MARQRVDFTEVNNPMLRFLADDGTEFLIKMNLMVIYRTDEKLPDGQFKHELRMTQTIEQLAPGGEIDVRKLAGGDR